MTPQEFVAKWRGVRLREFKKRTLTNLYNARPTWRDMAYEELDKAVLDAYGRPASERAECACEVQAPRTRQSG